MKPGDLVRFDVNLQAGPKGMVAMIISPELPVESPDYIIYKVLVGTEIRRINSDYLKLVKTNDNI